ncbi:MAG: hypothetical protein M1355_03190 [Patescibacteria group bacterium]|nr:hypothetical protein [Patescibacteria group bacterium]
MGVSIDLAYEDGNLVLKVKANGSKTLNQDQIDMLRTPAMAVIDAFQVQKVVLDFNSVHADDEVLIRLVKAIDEKVCEVKVINPSLSTIKAIESIHGERFFYTFMQCKEPAADLSTIPF